MLCYILLYSVLFFYSSILCCSALRCSVRFCSVPFHKCHFPGLVVRRPSPPAPGSQLATKALLQALTANGVGRSLVLLLGQLRPMPGRGQPDHPPGSCGLRLCRHPTFLRCPTQEGEDPCNGVGMSGQIC